MNQSSRTVQNLGIVYVASLVQLVVQFLIQAFIASQFGALEQKQAFASVLALPTFVAAVVTGSIGYVLIPELQAKFSRQQDREGWQLASYIGLLTVVLSCIGWFLLYALARPICQSLFREEQLQLCSLLLRMLSVQVLFNGLISWLQALHHGRQRFLAPALGGVMGTLTTLAWAFVNVQAAEGRDSGNIMAIATAINLGSLVSVIVHLSPVIRNLCWPSVDRGRLAALFALYWPLMLGAAFLRVEPVVDRVLAEHVAGGSLEEISKRAVAHLHDAQRILVALVSIGTSGLSLIAFPQLAERLATQGKSGFAEHFALACRRLTVLVIPVSLGVGVFATWIVRDLLQRGAFTLDDSRVVGNLILASMGMFVGASYGELLARGHYVLGDTRSPTIIGVLSLTVAMIGMVITIEPWGVYGIGLGVSAYFLISAAIMAIVLGRQLGAGVYQGMVTTSAKSVVAALAACAVCYGVYSWGWGKTWIAAPTGAVSYFGVLLLLQESAAVQILKIVFSRLRLA
ncbi:MAG: polysaccharide biosynthesis C-terminal domain-containing protein [Planctomycetales bacterium]|nr:polysaccharide biosynthesis C-terminal domain-containing protein [Planctomycetales bacterium]